MAHRDPPEKRNPPTHVGKTGAGDSTPAPVRKHPHARGEDDWPLLQSYCQEETPPRTWGRRRVWVGKELPRRNTPTHVGKTLTSSSHFLPPQKHPHARGEDVGTILVVSGMMETPPRTWGRRSASFINNGTSRNTPTHVGKTGRRKESAQAYEKHPHARGEDRPPSGRRR